MPVVTIATRNVEPNLETSLKSLSREINRFAGKMNDAIENAGGKRLEFSAELKAIWTLIADMRTAKAREATNGPAAEPLAPPAWHELKLILPNEKVFPVPIEADAELHPRLDRDPVLTLRSGKLHLELNEVCFRPEGATEN